MFTGSSGNLCWSGAHLQRFAPWRELAAIPQPTSEVQRAGKEGHRVRARGGVGVRSPEYVVVCAHARVRLFGTADDVGETSERSRVLWQQKTYVACSTGAKALSLTVARVRLLEN